MKLFFAWLVAASWVTLSTAGHSETDQVWRNHHPGENPQRRHLLRAEDTKARNLGSEKVKVCKIPPGNEDNFHTIFVSENAVEAHLNTGSLLGSCDEVCDSLCDDGNKCTIDHYGDCEDNGCATEPRAEVICNDGIECTIDSCDPDEGCIHDDTPCAVQITQPGEAYGHHGQCSGWNRCNDAGTCALHACNDHGYDTLVSFGATGPCTGFDVCHLFWNIGPDNFWGNPPDICNVQYNWGNWCAVNGVTDIVCKEPSDICVYDGP